MQLVVIAGWAVHGAIGFIGVIFAAVWLLIVYLRAEVKRREQRGLLPGSSPAPLTAVRFMRRDRADPRVDQARRRQAAPGRRDPQPNRTQGPDHRGPGTEGRQRRSSPAALRRARGQAVLRFAAGVHHLRPRGGRHRGRPAGRCRVPPDRRRPPIRWRRPRPAPSAATWPSSPRTTSCTAPIRPIRQPAKSSSGFPANRHRYAASSVAMRRDVGYWSRVAGRIPGPDARMKT